MKFIAQKLDVLDGRETGMGVVHVARNWLLRRF
jgi:hypothetical protein